MLMHLISPLADDDGDRQARVRGLPEYSLKAALIEP
jgi:hypothetical protein